MEQALIGALALIVGVAIGFAGRARLASSRLANAEHQAARIVADAENRADAQLKEAQVAAREEQLQQRAAQERELGDRRAELAKIEERVSAKEEALAVRIEELNRREQSIADRETHAKQMQEELKAAREQQIGELERIAGLTAAQARDSLLSTIEDETRHDMARLVRRIEEEAKIEADRRARNILAVAIQRTASSHTAETTVSVVQLPSDEMKGRIIGREGRNIRALEKATGVDVIIDDTPGRSCSRPSTPCAARSAQAALEKLISDGRIHPIAHRGDVPQAKHEIEEAVMRGTASRRLRGQRARPAPGAR